MHGSATKKSHGVTHGKVFSTDVQQHDSLQKHQTHDTCPQQSKQTANHLPTSITIRTPCNMTTWCTPTTRRKCSYSTRDTSWQHTQPYNYSHKTQSATSAWCSTVRKCWQVAESNMARHCHLLPLRHTALRARPALGTNLLPRLATKQARGVIGVAAEVTVPKLPELPPPNKGAKPNPIISVVTTREAAPAGGVHTRACLRKGHHQITCCTVFGLTGPAPGRHRLCHSAATHRQGQ